MSYLRTILGLGAVDMLWNLRYDTKDIASKLGLKEADVWNYRAGSGAGHGDEEGARRRANERRVSEPEEEAGPDPREY